MGKYKIEHTGIEQYRQEHSQKYKLYYKHQHEKMSP